jgi:hypothetical protein
MYLAVVQDEATGRSTAARAPAAALKTPNVKSQRNILYTKTPCQATTRMTRISFQSLGERHHFMAVCSSASLMDRSLSLQTCCAGGKPDLASLVDQAGLSGEIPSDVVKDVRKIGYGRHRRLLSQQPFLAPVAC